MNELEPIPDIRDIAPVWELSAIPPWAWVAGVGLGLALLGLLLLLFLRRRGNGSGGLMGTGSGPTPKEAALERIRKLLEERASLDPITFSARLCDILRQYLSAQYHLDAPRQTSKEFLIQARKSPLFTEQKRSLLGAFLETCDRIKYAHQVGGEAETEQLLEQAWDVLEARKP